jgi:hypothetical protein
LLFAQTYLHGDIETCIHHYLLFMSLLVYMNRSYDDRNIRQTYEDFCLKSSVW